MLALPVLFAVAPGASASGTITQGDPMSGATLTGHSFAAQLVVSGTDGGSVTFAQLTGSENLTVSSTGQVTAPALAAGNYSATGTDSDNSGDSGIWSFTLQVLDPAPAGFEQTAVGVYQGEYTAAEELGQGSSIQSVAQYSQQISQLNSAQLAAMYAAAQETPEWYQIPTLMQTVVADAPPSSSALKAEISLKTKPAALKLPAKTRVVTKSAKPLGVHALNSPDASSFPATISPFTPETCPADIPDAAIFALQIVVDAAQGVYNITLALAVALADALDIQAGLGVAATVAGAVLLAAVIVHDVLAYLQQLYNDCANNNLAGEVSWIDGNTVQTYALIASVASSVTDLQTTDAATYNDVQTIMNQITTLQTTFTTTLQSDLQATQSALGSDIQGVGTQLQTVQTGIQNDVTTIDALQNTLGTQLTNQVNTDTASIGTSLSADLSQILTQINTTANGLTSLITTDNAQIMATLNGNFTAQQNEYYANLKLTIEKALGSYGTGTPQVQLMLPASQGGFLNSTPVGVQSVVTADLAALAAMGVKTSPANNYLNSANKALATNQYITAYDDYALCYEAFA